MATELVPEVVLIITFSMCISLNLIVTSSLSHSVFVLLSSGIKGQSSSLHYSAHLCAAGML